MSTLRFRVVEKAFQAKPMEVPTPDKRPGEYFGKYVFNREKMFKYLPSTVFARLIDAMDNGAALDRQIADAVAEGMKRWASELNNKYSEMNDARGQGVPYANTSSGGKPNAIDFFK
jgi:glutamine synthetase